MRNLIYALRVKLLARAAGVAAIETDGDLLVVRIPAGWNGDGATSGETNGRMTLSRSVMVAKALPS